METNEDGKDVVVGGYEYQIFDTIADKLKYVVFMYEYIEKTSGSFSFKYDISLPKICCMWGGPMDDQKKNFSGLVGDLLNGYSDIGWANLFFNLDQAQVMDYTDAYAVDYLAWMVKHRNVLL